LEIFLRVIIFLFGLVNVGLSLAELAYPGFSLSEGPTPTRLEILPHVAALLIYGFAVMGSCMNLSKRIIIPVIFVLAIGVIIRSGFMVFYTLGHLRGYFWRGALDGYPAIVFLLSLLIILPAFGALFLAWRQRPIRRLKKMSFNIEKFFNLVENGE